METLKKVILRYEINDINLEKIGNRLFKIKIEQEVFLDNLPEGSLYKGVLQGQF